MMKGIVQRMPTLFLSSCDKDQKEDCGRKVIYPFSHDHCIPSKNEMYPLCGKKEAGDNGMECVYAKNE